MTPDARPDNHSDFHHLHGGGVIERGDLERAYAERLRQPVEWRGEHFELVDARGEVIDRAGTPYQSTLQADRLGVSRYVEVGLDGKRALHEKVDGSWQASAEGAPASATSARPPPAPLTPLEAGLAQRYVIGPAQVSSDELTGQTQYRFRDDPDRVAFTATKLHVHTDVNSPSAVRSMVDLAESRQWRRLLITGHVDFKRMVWLEASVRGVKAIGYEPVAGDAELLREAREARQVDRNEPTAAAASSRAGTAKASARGSGSRKTVLAAIEAVLVAQRVPEQRREAIMVAAAENLAKRLAAGEVHKIKVYDKAAPAQRTVAPPAPEQQRGPERTARVR